MATRRQDENVAADPQAAHVDDMQGDGSLPRGEQVRAAQARQPMNPGLTRQPPLNPANMPGQDGAGKDYNYERQQRANVEPYGAPAGDVYAQDEPDMTDEERAERERQRASGDPRFAQGDRLDSPEYRSRFDDDGNPIDANGRPRQLDPGEAPMDDVERELHTVGKGGVTVRGKVFVEGDSVLLSENEANQITDMGNSVTHTDPVVAKEVAERRADRDAQRRERHADRHAQAQEEAKEL